MINVFINRGYLVANIKRIINPISGNLLRQFAYFIISTKTQMTRLGIIVEDISIVRLVKTGDVNSFSLLVNGIIGYCLTLSSK